MVGGAFRLSRIAFAEQLGGPPMELAELDRRERAVHSSAQQRLGVADGRVIAENARADERGGGGARLVVIHVCQCGRLGERGLAEYRHRLRKAPDRLRVAPQARDHHAADRLRR
jgi:hypothetical protein